MKSSHRICPACGEGHLQRHEFVETFLPRGREVEVALLGVRCDECNHETVLAAQQTTNLERLAARKPLYGGLLMGEEILALRKRYGLTQQAAAAIFGKGKIAFSRYENEVTYPDDSTTLLLTLAIEMPAALKWLADRADVELPLWRERQADARAAARASQRPAADLPS